ncbi:MAG: hypothetical protein JSW66_07355, partial [Phycisphaerales bacterium]
MTIVHRCLPLLVALPATSGPPLACPRLRRGRQGARKIFEPPVHSQYNGIAFIWKSRSEKIITEVTCILNAIEQGDERAVNKLLPLVYEELRRLVAHKMSHEPPGQTLQATALVHEAYIRLVGSEAQSWNSRTHFFCAAADAMRHILTENARRKRRLKRG